MANQKNNDSDPLSRLLEANRNWAAGAKTVDPSFFDVLASQQSPDYLWIGCSDSRVPANQITGLAPGEVFVHRNIANVVVHSDFNCLSVIEYAVRILKVKHIIVCGHYDCGGVRASIENRDHTPPLENWLRSIRDVYRLHSSELNAIKDPEQRHRRLVELNVIEQCINLFKTGVVQRKRVETFRSDEFR